jgi:beta-galactosidase
LRLTERNAVKALPVSGPVGRAEPLLVSETAASLMARNERLTFSFNKLTGQLNEYVYKGVPLLLAGPSLNLWRAPVDNDVHLAKEWVSAGYDRLESSVRQFVVSTGEQGEPCIQIEQAIGARGEQLAFHASISYRFNSNGGWTMDVKLIPLRDDLPPLPRFGLELRLPNRFDRLAWFGLGPHECYADRKESGKLGLYSGTVQEQFVPYEKPQENGNKSDVRWCALTDKGGAGFRITSQTLFQVSAHHYSTADMSRSAHIHQLTRLNETIVKLDAAQSGIGNHSCGYAPTLEPYLVPAGEMSLSFVFSPI